MRSLRARVLHLARTNSQVRPHLLPLLKTATVRQTLLWIPPRTRGTIAVPYAGPKPDRTWTLPRERNETTPPALPFYPVHGLNAALEDMEHDWKVQGGIFRYSSRSTEGECWVLLEFDSKVAALRKTLTREDVESLSAAAVNKALDRLDAEQSKLLDALIEAGLGTTRLQTILKLDHPVARQYAALTDQILLLQEEIKRRYGPGAPSRLPRGFGPASKR